MDYQKDQLTRADRDIILSIIPPNSHVLDLGCGDGGLLAELIGKKEVIGRGLEIDEGNLIKGLERGISVYQGDLNDGLVDYPDNSYDYVILNQTLQFIKNTKTVLNEMLRVGKYAIVGVPNFGYCPLRLNLLFHGRMPKFKAVSFDWYNTPNIHMMTILDFKDYCKAHKISIIREEYLMFGKWRHSKLINPLANLYAITGMFVLKGNVESIADDR